MEVEYDETKSTANERERGLPFWLVQLFDFNTALVMEDRRRDYPERRFVATGYIGERLYIVCFTPKPSGIRVISLRKANRREARKYAEETADK